METARSETGGELWVGGSEYLTPCLFVEEERGNRKTNSKTDASSKVHAQFRYNPNIDSKSGFAKTLS